PSRAMEKELARKLNERAIKSDVEVAHALLDLAVLNIREKRGKEALQLFEIDQLRKFPAVMKAREQFKNPGQYLILLSTLGKGVVLAYSDAPEESNAKFKSVMTATLKAKPFPKSALDEFLSRYEWWKKAVADALDRNAKNLGGIKLEEP